MTEPIGDSVIVDVKVGEALMRPRADVAFQAHIEDAVYMTFKIQRMPILDEKSGTTLIWRMKGNAYDIDTAAWRGLHLGTIR